MYDCGNPHCISMRMRMHLPAYSRCTFVSDCLTVFHREKENYTVILCLIVKFYKMYIYNW
jgi:hypothetical protein